MLPNLGVFSDGLIGAISIGAAIGAGTSSYVGEFYRATEAQGDIRIDAHFPDADGTDNEWTRSEGSDDYTLLDEHTANVTDYLYTDTIGAKVSVSLEPLWNAGGEILTVQQVCYLTKANAGPCEVTPYVRVGGVKFFAEKAGAYWFLDIVATELVPIIKRGEDFLSVLLAVKNDKATITVRDHHGLLSATVAPAPADRRDEVRAFLVKYYGAADHGQTVLEPLHTVTSKARFGLVTVRGEQYHLVDIGMRMLQPHELFAAQGFPDGYDITTGAGGKPLTKTQQIALCGNSVCPPHAEALVRANARAA
jgi:hypothetical protein